MKKNIMTAEMKKEVMTVMRYYYLNTDETEVGTSDYDEMTDMLNSELDYLEKKYQQENLAQDETLKAAEEDTPLGQEKAKQGGKLMGLENLSLAQAIMSAEILGQPRCRQRRIR